MATSFNTALGRGYSVVYCLQVEGIPWLFTEYIPHEVIADEKPAEPTYYASSYGGGVCAGLIIDGQKVSEEIDREKGVSRARALDMTLAYQPLSGAGILDDLFARPTLYSNLNADVDTTDTSFAATSVGGGWSAGAMYIGNEYLHSGSVAYSDPNTTFSSITRGHWGDKYDHKKTGFTGSQWVTNRPHFWRGRMVTLWECLVDPEGRAVFTEWMAGDYCRQAFKGYIDTNPLPGNAGFKITAQSMTRRLTKGMGYSGMWTQATSLTQNQQEAFPNSADYQMVGDKKVWVNPQLYDPGTMSLSFDLAFSDGDTFTGEVDTSGVADHPGRYKSIHAWCLHMAEALASAASEVENGTSVPAKMAIIGFDVVDDSGGVTIKQASTCHVPNGAGAPYFLTPGQTAEGKKASQIGGGVLFDGGFCLEKQMDWQNKDVKPWLVLVLVEAETYQDYSLPASGLAICTDYENNQELISFSGGTHAGKTDLEEYYALHVDGRGLNDEIAQLNALKQFKLVTGSVGTLATSILKFLESSGTGERGTLDTLGYGMGYAIDDGHIDLSGIQTMYFADREVVAVDEGRQSFEDVLGGWITLNGSCLCMTRNSSGVLQISPRKHEVLAFSSKDPAVITITAADVLLDGLSPLEVVEAPNEVRIQTKSEINDKAPDIIARSIPEMIREGITSWSVRAPSMQKSDAYIAAQRIIALGAGQYAMTLTLGPWVNIQAGDPCILELSGHLGTFDFSAGTLGTSSLSARCVGVSRDLVTMKQEVRFLLYGKTLPGTVYSPATTVTAHSGSTITLDTGEGGWFVADDPIRLYNPGKEALGTPEVADMTVQSVSGDVVTLTASAPAWVVNDTTRATYPRLSIATDVQDTFFHFAASYRWN